MRKIIEANGLGNSFLIVDQGEANLDDLSSRDMEQLHELLIRSRRDSLLVTATSPDVNTNDKHQKQMRVLESDSTESLMCGNGLRALAQYFWETELVKDLVIKTRAGLRTTKVLGSNSIIAELGVFHTLEKIQLTEGVLHDSNVGEPHAVIMTTHQQVDHLFNQYGLPLACDGQVEDMSGVINHLGTRNLNAVVVNPQDPTTIYNRTFERGVNRETKACGTGSACAANIYAQEVLGTSNFDLTVITNGGKLYVKGKNNSINIQGPAKIEKIHLL